MHAPHAHVVDLCCLYKIYLLRLGLPIAPPYDSSHAAFMHRVSIAPRYDNSHAACMQGMRRMHVPHAHAVTYLVSLYTSLSGLTFLTVGRPASEPPHLKSALHRKVYRYDKLYRNLDVSSTSDLLTPCSNTAVSSPDIHAWLSVAPRVSRAPHFPSAMTLCFTMVRLVSTRAIPASALPCTMLPSRGKKENKKKKGKRGSIDRPTE